MHVCDRCVEEFDKSEVVFVDGGYTLCVPCATVVKIVKEE